jgi:hypothetical protein
VEHNLISTNLLMLLLMKFTASPEASVGINRADHSDAQQPPGIGHLEVISRATATMIFAGSQLPVDGAGG